MLDLSYTTNYYTTNHARSGSQLMRVTCLPMVTDSSAELIAFFMFIDKVALHVSVIVDC
jgi:hypothetical protein